VLVAVFVGVLVGVCVLVTVGVAVGALYDGNDTVYVVLEYAVLPPLLVVDAVNPGLPLVISQAR
jgi:hypothetical protein